MPEYEKTGPKIVDKIVRTSISEADLIMKKERREGASPAIRKN